MPVFKFEQESFIANIENLFINLLGYCSDKQDYEELDTEERISYNLTSEQLCLANKLRKVCDVFKQQAMKTITKNKKENDPIIKILKNLSNDKKIHITRADKGRVAVVLDRVEYINKMETILSDSKTFKLLDEDPTISKEDRLHKTLLHLKNTGYLTEEEYKYARPVGSQPGKAYGLPKIHKEGIPLRPIVSSQNTFNYKLSKLLVKKLKHLRNSSTIITDTFKFTKELQKLNLDTKKVRMISFDITSLFTRVPLSQTINLILNKMYGPPHSCFSSRMKREEWCNNCKQRYELRWLLDISTKESHFVFNKKIYCQVDGIAMGSPLGPLFDDIYVNHLESELRHQLENNGVMYWRRFVDDCFVIIKENTDINKLLYILNNFDNNIQFTCEMERNNSLPFLDILITRETNNRNLFSTSIYRKPAFTGLLLKWSSHVPHSCKVSAISSMIYRAIMICSSYTAMHTEFEDIQNLALANGYPKPNQKNTQQIFSKTSRKQGRTYGLDQIKKKI